MNSVDKTISDQLEKRYHNFGLISNPFPKSGTANIHESSERTFSLPPIDNRIVSKLMAFVNDANMVSTSNDYKLVGTVTGDYGTGKTQLLLYARELILRNNPQAFVLYINNPGIKVSGLIGTIIENIGREDFKKFIWNQIIEGIERNESYRQQILQIFAGSLYITSIPIDENVKANYKSFIQFFLQNSADIKKNKEFSEIIKDIGKEILYNSNNKDAVVAEYFFNLIVDDVGISKSWEELISGNSGYLESKTVHLINSVVKIIEDQGYNRFFLLVDEFEDITSGRLTKKEQDTYTRNLRTLLDKERRWSLLVAMTSQALTDIQTLSPPLYDRMTDHKIEIKRFSSEEARTLIISYLNLGRTTVSDEIFPFSQDSITFLTNKSKGLPRIILRDAYFLLERAVEELKSGDQITVEFATRHMVR